MSTYLTIITTILVITQVIRVTQNHISLKRQEKEFKRNCEWVRDTEITKQDFEVQRKVFYLLLDKLADKKPSIRPKIRNIEELDSFDYVRIKKEQKDV